MGCIQKKFTGIKMKRSNYLSLLALTTALALPSGNCFSALPSAVAEENAFIEVGKKAIPAVVSIKVRESADASSDEMDELFSSPFWQNFFDLPKDAPKEQFGQGSGFLVSSDGYVMTNGHVVEKTDQVIVTLNDGREFPAKIIGLDPNTDIALIKIEAESLPYLTFANSDELQAGQWVVAIGTPLGLQASLTTGVISAIGRNNLDLTQIEDFIQTDASLNRGNSGGPLLNLNSDVIGINTAIASTMGGYMGIGFAVPSNIAKNVLDQLLKKGSVSRGFLGIALQPVNANLAASFGLTKPQGVLVAEVSKESPAEKSGIVRGDIILKYNNTNVTNIGSLRNAIALMAPGTQLDVTVIRKGKEEVIKGVVVGDFSKASQSQDKGSLQENTMGLTLQNINPELVKTFKIEGQGVVITKVDPNSIAFWAGLRKGMLIAEINHEKVQTVEQFKTSLQKAQKDKPILLLIREGSLTRYLSIKIN